MMDTDILWATPSVNNGADVNATATKQATPLHRAVEMDLAELVELFIQKGADVEARGAHA